MKKRNLYGLLDPLMALLVMAASGGAALFTMASRVVPVAAQAAAPAVALAAAVGGTLLIPEPAHAGPQGCTGYDDLVVFADEQITVSTTAVGFTSATYAPAGLRPADMAVVTLETADLRYRSNGLNPTSAVGTAFPAPSTILVCGNVNISRVKFIRAGSVDGIITVQYSRAGGS